MGGGSGIGSAHFECVTTDEDSTVCVCGGGGGEALSVLSL